MTKKISIQEAYEELNCIDSWEDWFGTDTIVWYDDYDGWYPYWLGYVKDKAAAKDYAFRNRGVWTYGRIEE